MVCLPRTRAGGYPGGKPREADEGTNPESRMCTFYCICLLPIACHGWALGGQFNKLLVVENRVPVWWDTYWQRARFSPSAIHRVIPPLAQALCPLLMAPLPDFTPCLGSLDPSRGAQ